MVRDLLAIERDRYLRPVMSWGLTPDAPQRVRTARRAIVRATDHTVDPGVGRLTERKVPA